MDVVQQRLRNLIEETDHAYSQLLQHPGSEDYAAKYEQAKNMLDHYLSEVKLSLNARARSR